MTTWVTAYNKACSGAKVNYTSTNSGQGVADFNAGKIGFGGSDAALNPDATPSEVDAAAKACGSPAWDLPMVTGPIAVAFNVKGVTDLTLNAQVLTKIFLGKITSWDDAAIKALNSSATLPSEPIKVFFRGDPSGTSKNFEKYLSVNDPTDWGSLVVDKPWPGKAGSGVTGSPAVAAGVKSTEGGIGYMEWSYAGLNSLATAKVDNGAGAVALSADTAGAFVAGAKITGTNGDLTLSIDYTAKTPNAYPIVLVTYEIVCSKYKDAATGALVKSFLTYTASAAGQGLLPAQGYAPLPASILSKVQDQVAAIK
jgi:phosphate transport system substrate-binding protein